MELYLYIPRDTFLHRLDPRTKMFCLLGFFTLAMVFNHPVYVLILLFFTLFIGYLGQVLQNLRRIWWFLLLIFLFSSILWPFFVKGQTLLFKIGSVQIWKESLFYAIAIGLRLDLMVISGLIFLSCTMVEEFITGLRKLGLPYVVSFALSAAFRLVPTLLGATSTVVQAQRSRGLDLESGNIFVRIRKYIPLLIPVFIYAIRNTDLLAMALESKGFGAKAKRTYYLELKMRVRDYLALFLVYLLVGLCFCLRFKGIGEVLDRI